MKRIPFSLCPVLVISLISFTSAKTIKVPQDYAKIQLAINAAVNGDTVLVAEGTYFENLLVKKKIVLGSLYLTDKDTSHISKTILDGGVPTNADSASVFHVTTGTDSNTIITGFTIQNGNGTRLYDPSVARYWRSGAGINIFGGGATITHNIIRHNNMNTSDGVYGGGIAMYPIDGALTYWIIENNQIVNNAINSTASSSVGAEGGGVWLTEDGRFMNNVVSSNSAFGTAYSTAGGIDISGATGFGSSTIEVSNNIIKSNSSGMGSALGLWVDPGKSAIPYVLFRNNVIVENISQTGATIRAVSGNYTFVNNTIANNTSFNTIALLTNRGPLSVKLLNNIIWNPASWNDLNSLDFATAQNNCLRGGYPGTGNISADPNFISSDPYYRLSDSSYCIGRGADSAQLEGVWLKSPQKDITAALRPNPSGSWPDIGAVEHASGTVRSIPWQPVDIAFLWGGVSRSCIIEFPKKFAGQKNLPVVFSLNGYGGDALTQRNYEQNHVLGDSVGYITVYPEAYQRMWNSGISDYTAYPTPAVDDVGFISAIIDTLVSRYSIDTTRVYACGYSNGGFMSLRLAGQLSRRIAAVASVCGVLTWTSATNYVPLRPVPVMMIHGTVDPTVPYDGGYSGWYSVPQTISFLIQKNGSSSSPETLFVPDRNHSDKSQVEGYIYKSASNKSQVKLYKVVGGSHEWPGAPPYIGSGVINYDIDANSEIWDFFKQFTTKDPVGAVDQTPTALPAKFTLEQNYPNPFNPATIIRYSLPAAAHVKLTVYNMLGQVVSELVNEEQSAGWKEVQWNASNVSSGMYFYKLQAGNPMASSGQGFVEVKKLLFLK